MLENGEIHTLFFENDSENGQLMIASKTKPLRRYLNNNMKEAHKGKPNVLNKIQDAIDSAIIIDKIRKTRDPEKHELIRTEMNRLAKILKEIPAPPPSELPPSVVEYGQVRGADGDATSMTAWILSKKNIVGSPPRASTKLWKKVKKKKFKKSGATRFVRGHLLNEWFGGPGDPYNLTPITRTANKKHVSDVENPIWDGLNEGKVYYYKVKVVYKEGSNEEVAEKLICVWQELEYKSKKWERKKGTRKKVVIDNA
ncbi:MAG TPA: DNA/RNA non-specific endonuclease [Chitinophagales bacterium]|nr:DNA/RNA non-specific endonuclease [Chitinophagales bacterium]